MNRWLKPLTSPAARHGWLLILRLTVAGTMLTHGIPKLQKIMANDWSFGDPLGLGTDVSLILAVFAEVGCSLLLLVGFMTRLATLPLLFTMAVAIIFVHGGAGFGKQELPLLYALIYLTLFVTGPGRYSIDGSRGLLNTRSD